MDKVHQRSFKTAEARQLFNRYATYNGSDPYQTPGLLTLIPHLECQLGAYFPKSGMYSITLSIAELAKKLGVQFHFNCKVDEILHDANKVIGIRMGEKKIVADVVVSNLDIHPTYHKLLPKLKKPLKVLNQQRSSSALIFYWGITKTFPQLGLHNILFSADYQEEFKHLFKLQTISKDPTLYINISSKYKADDAPQGHENWFMMINVPNNNQQDWDQLIADARIAILAKVSKMLDEDIGSLITCENVLEPRTIESKTGSYQGSLYGNSSNSPMAAFFRHNNKHEDINGLYFVGGSVHPGGGIPLALSSAKIVADLVEGI
jgi:phytoene desaturase